MSILVPALVPVWSAPTAAQQILSSAGVIASLVLLVNCGHRQNTPQNTLSALEHELQRHHLENSVYWDLTLKKAQLLEQLNRREEALEWLHAQTTTSRPPADLAVRLAQEMAAIETDLGRFGDADRDLERGIALARSSGQARMAAVLEVRWARVLIRLDNPVRADEALSHAEDYVHTSGDLRLVPYILHYRGLAGAARNEFEEAIAPLRQSLELFRQDPSQQALAANVMISLASCYYHLGRVDEALSLYQQALRLSLPDDRHLALGHLGNIYYSQRDFAMAAANYRQAASMAKGRDQYYYFLWLDNLATALIEQNKCEEAERANSEVVQFERDSSLIRQAQINLGRAETCLGRYQAAEPILRKVANSRDGDLSYTLDAYARLAEMYTRMGKPEAAKPEFDAALALADETTGKLRDDENKLSYLSNLIDLNQEYVDFLMSRGDTMDGFAVAESSRARLLRERLNLPSAHVHTRTVAEYCAAAKAADTTFLAYWIGPERSYLWEISGARFAPYLLPPEREIRRLVEQYQAAIEGGEPLRPNVTAAGAKLFDVLLPAAVRKAGGRYIIVPDGPLYSLNFETLPVPSEHPHFWIEDATVSIAPSLDLLIERRAAPLRRGSLLLVGDAVEWNSEYPKLLHAGQEMEGIETQFAAAKPKLLAGAEATPAAYLRSKPADYTYIHFTAHATANKNSPLDSAIILSEGPGAETGKLSVKQVLDTPLHAALVTISACHSAGARTYWGEGLVGFTWAFLRSGAQGVIAGLWDVSDYSSPRLMRDLYHGLAAGKSPASALRAAKLRMITDNGKYSGPYYWGAFQLYEGSWYAE